MLMLPTGDRTAVFPPGRLYVGEPSCTSQTGASDQRERTRNKAAGTILPPSDSFVLVGCLPLTELSPLFLKKQGESEEEDENLPIQEVSFDPEKAQCCLVESGQILTHGSGGKGYGLASTGVSSGCYQWKVRRLKRTGQTQAYGGR